MILTVASSSPCPGQLDHVGSNDHSPLELINRLQSDRFSIRQKAMFEIMENPKPVIPLIESVIVNADGDFQLRALKILEQVALKQTTSGSQTNPALDAIRRISLSDNDAISLRASASSYNILLCRQYRAARRLERLNARVRYLSNLDNEKYPLADQLIIDEKWKGSRRDLRQASLLFGLSKMELNHAQVDDELIAQLDAVYTLTGIKLKKCSITNLAISHMSLIGSLNEVEILYCPVGPGCFESLARIRHLSALRLIGTDIFPRHAAVLEQQLSATIDIRRGAFMGIRYDPATPRCKLTSLVPGSGAEQAGLRVGDEIIEFNQNPIEQYGDLTLLLRECADGDEAKIKIKRRDEELLFDVLMGEWE